MFDGRLLMTWQDWAANFCYLILAASYLVSDLYWLRILAIIALGLEGIYFYFGSTPPLWVGIGWSVVFVGINLVQLTLMTRERRTVNLSERERLLHRGLFAAARPGLDRLMIQDKDVKAVRLRVIGRALTDKLKARHPTAGREAHAR